MNQGKNQNQSKKQYRLIIKDVKFSFFEVKIETEHKDMKTKTDNYKKNRNQSNGYLLYLKL